MRRLHLIELHEQDWCPALLRHGLRAVLQQISRVMPGYEAVVDDLRAAIQDAGATEVLDLCAGSGGPWARIARRLVDGMDGPGIERVVLTDIFPDVEAMETMQRGTHGLVVAHPEPVDALAVPRTLSGFRTVFAAFHHFEPTSARKLLADAAEAGEGVGIFELTQRRPWAASFVVLGSLPVAWAVVPTLRPFRWAYLPFTYLIPLLPAVLAFDGFVSCLRSYEPDELLAMGREVAPHYEWRAGKARAPFAPLSIVYLIGVPPR